MSKFILAARACLLASGPAGADLYVVVNTANPVRALTTQEVSALYLGRAHSFPTGEFALIFDHPRDSPLQQAVIDIVRRNPGAIGYLGSTPPRDSGLRSVLEVKE